MDTKPTPTPVKGETAKPSSPPTMGENKALDQHGPAMSKGPSNIPVGILSSEQFKQLQTTLIYVGVVMGLLTSGKRPTPSPANLREVKDYVTAIKQVMNDEEGK